MFGHKLVLHLSSQRALARMAKPLSFHTIIYRPCSLWAKNVMISNALAYHKTSGNFVAATSAAFILKNRSQHDRKVAAIIDAFSFATGKLDPDSAPAKSVIDGHLNGNVDKTAYIDQVPILKNFLRP